MTATGRYLEQLRNRVTDIPMAGQTVSLVLTGTGAAGSPLPTFTDATGSTPLSSTGQVTLDSAGMLGLFAQHTFDIYLQSGNLFASGCTPAVDPANAGSGGGGTTTTEGGPWGPNGNSVVGPLYELPDGTKGTRNPANTEPNAGTWTAAESAKFVRTSVAATLVYNATNATDSRGVPANSYPVRPAVGVCPAGCATYVGPQSATPTDRLTNDAWRYTS